MMNWTLALALLACSVAAVTDLRSRTIPNWLTLPLALVALLGHGLGSGLTGMLFACVGLLACFLPLYVLFVRDAVGGGDVKLLAGLGALLGARAGLEIELTAFVLVALYALCSTAWHGRLLALLGASVRATLHLVWPSRCARPSADQGGLSLPMGLAILLSAAALAARTLLSTTGESS